MSTASSAPALVLAAFGTSEPAALAGIMNVVRRAEAAFPGRELRLAFTSPTIRAQWRARAADPAFRERHPDVPDCVYRAGNLLSELAAIQETGPRPVVVQPLHLTDGSEYRDVAGLAAALRDYTTFDPARRPFPALAVGEPALGAGDGRPEPLERAARALEPLARAARDAGAALVLMGHGNARLTQAVFGRLEAALNRAYGPHIHIGTVEAPPHAPDIARRLAAGGAPRNILLAPLMLVAGDHARNDMAGENGDSWAGTLAAAGYNVEARLAGLGELDSWADIYIEHIREAERGREGERE